MVARYLMLLMALSLVEGLLIGCAPTGRYPEGEEPSLKPDLVKEPRLVRPQATTTKNRIRITGYATPGHRVELFVNSLLAGETVTRSDGRFEFPQVNLRGGLNIITAVAIDTDGNRSRAHPAGGGARKGIGGELTPEARVVLKE